MTDIRDATHLHARAGVRYWEDGAVDGVEDSDGTLIPGRSGDDWVITVELATGKVVGWPQGVAAKVHYKVCDDGEYWLLDSAGTKLARRTGYVPNRFLCHGDNGFGDYIIMTIGADGMIAGYRRPEIVRDEWNEA